MIKNRNLFIILLATWLLMMFGTYAWYNFRPLYNHTPSMPMGWYILNSTNHQYQLDKTVIVKYEQPDWVRERKYPIIPDSTFVKRIKAVPGDGLKMEGRKIYRCNPECALMVERLENDRQGRPFPIITLPEIVPEGKFFLATDHERGFDSRYLGLFSEADILGVARHIN